MPWPSWGGAKTTNPYLIVGLSGKAVHHTGLVAFAVVA